MLHLDVSWLTPVHGVLTICPNMVSFTKRQHSSAGQRPCGLHWTYVAFGRVMVDSCTLGVDHMPKYGKFYKKAAFFSRTKAVWPALDVCCIWTCHGRLLYMGCQPYAQIW